MILLLKPFLLFLLFFINRLTKKPFLPPWVTQLGLLVFLLCQELILHSLEWVKNCSISINQTLKSPAAITFKRSCCSEAENHDPPGNKTVLDLPELALELILAKLSPLELYKMGCVSRALRRRCRSDHLWERHFREKWSRVLGEAGRRKWEQRVASRREFSIGDEAGGKGGRKPWKPLPANSIFSFYLEIESGRFSFPAQIYNRESVHGGFSLSCHDAEISYNHYTNMFYVRYPPHGKRSPAIEEVPWDRIRAASVDASPHNLHISDCLSDLHPGDHIEIQWRRNKEFPYGWWYGVVGHLENCKRREHNCLCHKNETIMLEFNQYAPGSRWRGVRVDRKEHREEGNENDGFHGGIRKLRTKEEISAWMQIWSSQALE
ncbi:F-box protein [Apostasia shenzhenica]|uniref:F-box protein n=1 Tax=Apostasia shenzhenica TaxID=1088818 RepID=A0A2I0A4Q9_9ASPA|nr:F-box protein [Apostasia shenzhenica]